MVQKEKLYYLLIFIFTFVLYGNTLFNGYSLDDEFVIKDNIKVHQGISGIKEIFTTHYSTGNSQLHVKFEYRPLVLLTFAIEYSFWGENPMLSHLVNILLYSLMLIILFKVLKRIFQNIQLIIPFIIVILYAAFPSHNEVVASLKNRDEILSSLFGFLFILFSINYIDKKKIFYLFFAALFLGTGLLSKKSIVIFPFLLILIFYFFRTISKKEFLFILLFSLLGVLFFYFLPKKILLTESTKIFTLYYENPLFGKQSLLLRLYLVLNTLFFYFKLSIFPHPLLFYYGYNMIPFKLNYQAIIAGLVLITIMFYTVKDIQKKKKSPVIFGLWFYLLGISIFTNLYKPILGIVGVRFLHVAILGLIISIIFGLKGILKLNFRDRVNLRTKKYLVFFSITGVILLLYSFKTIDKNFAWKSKLILVEHDMPYLRNSVKANQLAGNMYLVEAKKCILAGKQERAKEYTQRAKKYFKRTIELYPEENISKYNLGYIYFNIDHDIDSAYYYLNQVYLEKKKEILPVFTQAKKMLSKRDTLTALKLFEEVIHRDSSYIDAYTPLSKIYFKQGNLKKAIDLN